VLTRTPQRRPRYRTLLRLMVIGSTAVLAVAMLAPAASGQILGDSGTVNVIVANKTFCSPHQTTADGAVVTYLGDSCQSEGSSGTGVFDPFVRLQASPNEEGYNTNGTVQFDTKTGTWTHAERVSHIPVVDCPTPATGKCWELWVDINESNSTPYISLNKVEIYYASGSGAATLTGYPFSSPPSGTTVTEEYSFSGDILINDVNQGSGRGDLRYDIPLGTSIPIPTGCSYNPNDTGCGTYFVLYSKWGTSGASVSPAHDYTSDGGFEEWQVHIYTPSSVSTTLHQTTSGGADVNPTNNGTTISINAGDYVTDYATVTPSTATGSVAFKYYSSSSNCLADTGGTAAGGGALSSGSATSSTEQLTAGTYYWRAFFSSTTGSILSSSSDCSEVVTVNQPTSVSTTLHETTSAGADVTGGNNGTTITIHVNSYVTDYASVTPSTATGSVAFRYYTTLSACTNDTTGIGGAGAGTGAVSSGSAHSSTVQFTSTGTWYWKAFFSGTGLYLGSPSDCSEVVTVNQPTSVSTTLHETDSSGTDVSPANNNTAIQIDAGSYVTDHASVSPSTATGSVAFRYYDTLAACQGDTDGTGGTGAGGGTVSSGSATSDSLQFSTPGTYYWQAFFTGTGLNLDSPPSGCTEILTVNQYTPGMTTAQTVKITDSATITVSGGGDLSGTAYFQPFGDATCSTTPLTTSAEAVTVSGTSPVPVSATTIVTIDTAGTPQTVYWKVSYTSNNPAQTSILPTCTENTTLTITNAP
jgi:hypothetical protein